MRRQTSVACGVLLAATPRVPGGQGGPRPPALGARAEARASRSAKAQKNQRIWKSDSTSIPALLQSKHVQEDLGIKAERVREIEAALAPQIERSWDLLMNLRNTHDPEQRAAIQAQMTAHSEGYHAEILRRLSPRQADRLMQISARNAGVRALANPLVGDAVGVLPDQVEAIRTIVQESDEKTRALKLKYLEKIKAARAHIPPGDYNALAAFEREPSQRERAARSQQAIDRNDREAEREIRRVLTRGQLRRFEKWLGPPVLEADDGKPQDTPPPASEPIRAR